MVRRERHHNNGSLTFKGDGSTTAEGGTGDGFQLFNGFPGTGDGVSTFDLTLGGTGVYTLTADDQYIDCYDSGHGFLKIGTGTTVQGRGNVGDQNSTVVNYGTLSGKRSHRARW